MLPSKNGGDSHLKLAISGAQHLDVIGFGLGPRAELAATALDAAFNLTVDEWNGNPRLSLRLKDLRPAS